MSAVIRGASVKPYRFEVGAWIAESLRGGIAWWVNADGKLFRWQAEPYIDPAPDATWARLCNDFECHRSKIRPVLIRRALAAGGLLCGTLLLREDGRAYPDHDDVRAALHRFDGSVRG